LTLGPTDERDRGNEREITYKRRRMTKEMFFFDIFDEACEDVNYSNVKISLCLIN
jgi:hypothetical protein